MREILFRGQTRKKGQKVWMDGTPVDGKWVYGGVLQGVGDFSIIYGGKNANDPGDGLEKHCVYTDTLGQFTGLTDKNDKKIFEGDIVKDESGVVYPVVVGLTGFYLKYTPPHSHGFHYDLLPLSNYWHAHGAIIEVIGNIYDNPELLGGKEDGK